MLSTRYRRKLFNEGISGYLKWSLRSVERHYPEIKILEANTDIDHLHVLVSIPPKIAVSEVVRLIKCNTGKALRKRYDFLKYVYYGRGGIWSRGYFVSTAGITEEALRRYIEHQGREDRGQEQLEF